MRISYTALQKKKSLAFHNMMANKTTYLFGAELNTSLAVFFEEIDLEDKNNI